MERTILVPIDGSAESWDALDLAIELFEESSITVLHVISPEPTVVDTFGGYTESFDATRADTEELCDQARTRVDQAGFDTSRFDSVIETGRPARTIVSYVETNDIDHVVMGSRGLTGIKRILLGSVAEAVVRRSPAPVTVVR